MVFRAAKIIALVLTAALVCSCQKAERKSAETKETRKTEIPSGWEERTESARSLMFEKRIKDYEEYIAEFDKMMASDDSRAQYAAMLASLGEFGRATNAVRKINPKDIQKAVNLRALGRAYEMLEDKEGACAVYRLLLRSDSVADILKRDIYYKRAALCEVDNSSEDFALDLCGLMQSPNKRGVVREAVGDGIEKILTTRDRDFLENALSMQDDKGFKCLPSTKYYIMAAASERLKDYKAAFSFAERAIIADPNSKLIALIYLSLSQRINFEDYKTLVSRLIKAAESDKSRETLERLSSQVGGKGELPELEALTLKLAEKTEDPFIKEELEKIIVSFYSAGEKFPQLFNFLEKVGSEGRHRQADDLVATAIYKSKDHKTLSAALENRMAASTFTPPLIALKARLCEEADKKRCALDNWLGAALQWKSYQPWQKRALQWLGRFNMAEQAIDILEMRVQLEPYNKTFRAELIRALKNNRHGEVYKYYSEWEKSAAEDPDWQEWLGHVYYQAREYKRAMKMYNLVLHRHSEIARHRLNLARAQFAAGENEEAALLAKKSLLEGEQRRPYAAQEFFDIHIKSCEKLGRLRKCVEELKKAVEAETTPEAIREHILPALERF